jgi:phosphomannomutase
MLAGTNEPLSKIAASIPSYTIVKEKFDIKPGLSERVPAAMREKFAGQRIDLQDGVRVDWADRWVSVRASNTEPILRIIAEARDEAAARELIAQAQSALGL